MTRQLIRVTCLRSWECRGGHVDPETAIVQRKSGEIVPQEQLDRWHPRYLQYLRSHGYVKTEELTHCPMCGSAIPAADEVPNSFIVAT